MEANECSTLGSVLSSYVTKQMQRIQPPQNRLGIHSIPLDNFSFSTNLIKRAGKKLLSLLVVTIQCAVNKCSF